jgi:hypothetical protein
VKDSRNLASIGERIERLERSVRATPDHTVIFRLLATLLMPTSPESASAHENLSDKQG